MSTKDKAGTGLFAGAGIFMILCCAVGPAVIGAGAGSAIGGWLGLAVACVAAAALGLGMFIRGRRRGKAC
jgi:hypothetical protein